MCRGQTRGRKSGTIEGSSLSESWRLGTDLQSQCEKKKAAGSSPEDSTRWRCAGREAFPREDRQKPLQLLGTEAKEAPWEEKLGGRFVDCCSRLKLSQRLTAGESLSADAVMREWGGRKDDNSHPWTRLSSQGSWKKQNTQKQNGQANHPYWGTLNGLKAPECFADWLHKLPPNYV